MKLKNAAILSGLKVKGEITDARLSLLTKVMFLKYYDKAENNEFMVKKLNEHFNIGITVDRLQWYYVNKEEIANARSKAKYINY